MHGFITYTRTHTDTHTHRIDTGAIMAAGILPFILAVLPLAFAVLWCDNTRLLKKVDTSIPRGDECKLCVMCVCVYGVGVKLSAPF